MDWLKSLFNENSPNSITRVAFIWLVVNATFMAWVILIFGTENAVDAGIVFSAVSGVAAGLKLYQKKQEKK